MNSSDKSGQNRRIRVFISSTFRDMIGERDALMTQTWPILRKLCQERHVELVEVDLRWGIAEEQSTRRETLKLCLDEIRACRPFFIGLLGERYGWTPGDDAFTADLKEEQPWLRDLHGKSVTELEIFHGVLNNPDMAGRAFFYFRDPAYSQGRGPDFLSESPSDAAKQTALKALIRTAYKVKKIPLRETYPDPGALVKLVLADLTAAINAQYPIEDVPDDLTRDAQGHEAFAEILRRTYIGRSDYFAAMDQHVVGSAGPLVLVGDSGSGKSALIANWVYRWRQAHPQDFIFQHYIGGTADSADHWRLMTRLLSQIKRWTNDPDPIPIKHDDMLRDLTLWLNKARMRAQRDGARFILVLDALNQLEDHDHARLLGWLPEDPFTGPLQLIVSSLPGKPEADDPLAIARQRRWPELRVQPLTVEERGRMITDYLARFGKKLDHHRLSRLASAPAAANPLYLKILLDDLRVTGTHDKLDERLKGYLQSADIPALLKQVLTRYQCDYERDRKGLVAETLGLIYAARRGLSETELLQLLRSAGQLQLPLALWTPLRAALEDSLVDRGGILNFAHDYLRTAVEGAFAPDDERRKSLRLQLANYFENQPITPRTCDELPWLLKATDSLVRLRASLLHIDRFVSIFDRDEDELLGYWVGTLQEQRTMGIAYLDRFETWAREGDPKQSRIAYAANQLAMFLQTAALNAEAASLMRRALALYEAIHGPSHPNVSLRLNNLAGLLQDMNQLAAAEPLYRRALVIDEACFGRESPAIARGLSNLAQVLQATNRLTEAEQLMRQALAIESRALGAAHPNVAIRLANLAGLLMDTNRLPEAELLYQQALVINERYYGKNHPVVARNLGNLAQLLHASNRLAQAEPMMRLALVIDQAFYGTQHPAVARDLNNLAGLLQATDRLTEAESLFRQSLAMYEVVMGPDHPDTAIGLSNLASLLHDTGRLAEAEPMKRRALAIDVANFGPQHPNVARDLNNLATLLQATNRLAEAEQSFRQAMDIDERSFVSFDHLAVARDLSNLAQLLQATNRIAEALPLMRRALAIMEKSRGPMHPDIAGSLNNLAQLLKSANHFADAEPLMRRALEINVASFGTDHHAVARSMSNLAQLLQATKRLSEAEPLMRQALAIHEKIYGPEHPDGGILLNNLARLLQATGRLQEAEPLMRRMIEVFLKSSRKTGHLDPRLKIAVTNYVSLLHFLGPNPVDAQNTLDTLLHPFGLDLEALGIPSPRLRAVIEEVYRNPAQARQIATRLQREDPVLFREWQRLQ